MIKIWVDDERPKPEGYLYWAHSTNEAIVLATFYSRLQINESDNPQVLLDLDHDAGEHADDGGDYINVLKALSRPWARFLFGDLPYLLVHFHSANPVGVKNMRAIVKNCPWMEEVK